MSSTTQPGLVSDIYPDITWGKGIVSFPVYNCQSESIDSLRQSGEAQVAQYAIFHGCLKAPNPMPLILNVTVFPPDLEFVIVKVFNAGATLRLELILDNLVHSRSRKSRLRVGAIGWQQIISSRSGRRG